jgi:hypothetical protein
LYGNKIRALLICFAEFVFIASNTGDKSKEITKFASFGIGARRQIQHESKYSSADGDSSVLVDPGEERADPGIGLSVSRLAALSPKGDDADLLPDTVHDGQRTTAVTLTSTTISNNILCVKMWH